MNHFKDFDKDFDVEYPCGYTVTPNYHQRDKSITLKAKGLLSQMFSLPNDWDFTLKGLAYINYEGIDSIRAAIRELEQAGYIVRTRVRDEKGMLRGTRYKVYAYPRKPTSMKPTLENPTQASPTQDKPVQENPTQLNIDISRTDLSKKDKSITDVSSTDSIPILSPNPFPLTGDEGQAAAPPERKRKEAADQENEAFKIYREIILDNIEYEHLCQYDMVDKEMLDEIVDIMLETVCSSRKKIRIAGDDYPAELVKSKFMKLDSSHIQFVFDCMKENTTKIRNIRQYLRAVLFNAPSTINGYYSALVAHDMASGKI